MFNKEKMNEFVREYLIKAARQKDKFVYYSDVVKSCNLDVDISTEYGRKQLSDILGEVSEYENSIEEPRPLLSALAIYKDKNKNDHGNGFYKIAEQLGKGSFKNLKNELYGFTEAERCRQFWQNDEYYKRFASINTIVVEEAGQDFFTKGELDFFKIWQFRTYDPKNDEHVNAKNFLMNSVWEKSIYLANEIIKKLDGFDFEGKKSWSKLGSDEVGGRKIRVSKFKHYTWVKVFKNTNRGRKIYFTFGVDAHPDTEAFVYKIDYQRERGSDFSEQQKNLIDSLIPKRAKWNEIAFDDLVLKDWELLVNRSVKFIKEFEEHYDAIINAVWGEQIPPNLFKNQLIRKEKPTNGFDSIPETKKKFKGVDVDFQGKAKEQKDLGDAGEELVKQLEINFLKSKGLNDKAKLVEIVKDGKGYDVFSFDENGIEKYIEVKTTKGNELVAFYLSENEVDFMRLNQSRYSIYRVYNYDEENNFGEFFEISGDVEGQLLMKTTQYQVLIKK